MGEKRRFIDEDEDVSLPSSSKKSIRDDGQNDPEPVRKKIVIEDDVEDPRKAKKASKPAEEDDGPVGLDVDFGDTRVATRKGKLERLTLENAKVVRFALLPGFKVKAAETHFIDNKGTFVCLSNDEKESICCKKLGNPSLRALALVVQYTNAKPKDGTMPKGEDLEWEIKYLRMSRKNYNDIFALRTVEDDGDEEVKQESVYDFDIVMYENEETKIGYKFRKISSKTWWNQDPEIKAEILEAAEKFKDGKALGYYLGKRVDELEYKAMLREGKRKGSETDEV